MSLDVCENDWGIIFPKSFIFLIQEVAAGLTTGVEEK